MNDPFIAMCNRCDSVIFIAARDLYFSTSISSDLLQFFNFWQKHELVDKICAFSTNDGNIDAFSEILKLVNFFSRFPVIMRTSNENFYR